MFRFGEKKEMQSLINASRKALSNAEDKIVERDKFIEYQNTKIEKLQEENKILLDNLDFIYENSKSKKLKELRCE